MYDPHSGGEAPRGGAARCPGCGRLLAEGYGPSSSPAGGCPLCRGSAVVAPAPSATGIRREEAGSGRGPASRETPPPRPGRSGSPVRALYTTSLPARPPLGFELVHCSRCARRGMVPSRELLVHSAEGILCPSCRGRSAPLVRPSPTAGPSPSRSLPGPPRPRPHGLVGRPPMILVRSKEPASGAGVARTAATPGTFAVRCSECGRAGRLPNRLRATIRTPDIVCPSCRTRRPALIPDPRIAGSEGTVTSLIHCFACGRRGRLTRHGSVRVRPQELLCPNCRSAGPAGAPSALPRPLSARSPFNVLCFACGRAGRLPVAVQMALRPEEVLCPTCRTRSPQFRPTARWPSWSLDGTAVI